jgi:hypothetical protein
LFRFVRRWGCGRRSFRLSEFSGDGEGSVVDDVSVVGDDDDFTSADSDGGEHVAVGVVGIDVDAVPAYGLLSRGTRPKR